MKIDFDNLTPEQEEKMDDYFRIIHEKRVMDEYHMKKFHDNYSDRFEEIMEKIITKYESDSYYNRESKLGYQPRTKLYFFMFEYAQKHGRELTETEEDKYSNMFTSGIYFLKGYYIQIMNGQGSVVRIDKDERTLKLLKREKKLNNILDENK